MSSGGGEGLRVVSYGGGVQSNALLVPASQGRVPHRTFLFANGGADSEHPGTLRYVADVARPFAEAHGVELVELGSRRELIPTPLSNGMPGRRSCTAEFKIEVIRKWLKANGASVERPAHVAIGFSADEVHRVARRRDNDVERPEYPLIDLGLSRDDCAAIVADAGLPVPDRSACWFCPFHRAGYWADLRRDEPELFDRAARLERLINRRRRAAGRTPVWLTRHNKPLASAVRDLKPRRTETEGPERCDEGHCWT